ncbi:MAG: hypothetical protein QG657_2238 [Acidobacteriota bacterium]|nr:hypothetical protein [Acidobacteriota bacterium]
MKALHVCQRLLVAAALLLTDVGATVWGQQAFSTFAEADTEMMKLILGKWSISDRPYIYEYTNEFMRRIDGFQYFKFTISQFRDNKNMYAIFKSKKNGKSYFCRGKWHNKYGFQYSASRIVFQGKDKFIVYSKDNTQEIFFVAERIREE